jgi:hypothetical protein
MKEIEKISNNYAEKEKSEILKNLYEFGFEVGYYNHFELGWVLKKYNELIINARNLGIISPEKYYNDGKIKGRSNRGQIIEGEKIPNDEINKENINKPNSIQSDAISPSIDSLAVLFLAEPTNREFPSMIENGKVLKLPDFLQGLKLLRRN